MLADKVAPEAVSVELMNQYMMTAGIPDPDLVIRTSGEQRTSNFLVWQSVYAEWAFPPMYWPDFDEAALLAVLSDFGKRERRFGGLNNPPQP